MGIAPSPGTDHYAHPDAARLAAWKRVYENYLVVEDHYPGLARRFATAGVTRFAEIGGGRGPIADYLHATNVENWLEKARTIAPPLNITKIGAHVWARR